MAAIPAFICIFLFINVITGFTVLSDEKLEIEWPTKYHFTGEKYDFDTTLKEPFEIWYSAEHNSSRVDFYGGTSKKYYDGNSEVIYSVFPMAESDMSSEVICGRGSFTLDDRVDFLPDTSELTFTGETVTLFDKVVDVWTSRDNFKDELIKEQTLYVYKTDFGPNIPVQHVVKIFNEGIGRVESHVVSNYYNFKTAVSEQDVTLEDADECEFFGAPGKNFKKDVLMLHPAIPHEADMLFESYTKHHKKEYHYNEKLTRKRIFEKNWRMVHEHNRKSLGYRLELNAFSDRTPRELKYLTATFPSEEPSDLAQPFPHTLEEIDKIVAELPEQYDLRLEGAVSSVKNQGSCGSCWAFATTASTEGALAKVNGERVMDLSEQSLVDCSWSYSNLGCNGGLLNQAWRYVYENGIPTERDYGVYTEHDGFCKIKNMTTTYKIKGFALVTPHNPSALKVALYKYGAVAVTIHASETMMHYSNGVFYDFTCEGQTLNHAVTVVGYGVRNGEEFWLVKNSYGEDWGEDGYILMSAKDNNCLILDGPYYPIV